MHSTEDPIQPKKKPATEFPGNLVVRAPGFHCGGLGSVLGLGTEIPPSHEVWP